MSLYLELLTETGRHSYVRFVIEKGELRYTNAASRDKIRKSVRLGPVVEKELTRLVEEV